MVPQLACDFKARTHHKRHTAKTSYLALKFFSISFVEVLSSRTLKT